MGRSSCCEKMGLKKGPWTPEEDQKLLAYIEEHGHGNWRALPSKAGLQRCGKSCRLRWTNYLRPDIKRGKFSLQEEQTIIQLHALLGNRWSAIATHLPKRTDNEIKNYWNTHLKKRLSKMGIDPVTHKPKNDALLSAADGGPQLSKNAANLSHMAQWESARLEAEARLVRQSKLRSNTSTFSPPPPPVVDLHGHIPPPVSAQSSSSSSSGPPRCLDVLKAWHNTSVWPNTNSTTTTTEGIGIGIGGIGIGLESPTSTLSFSENGPVVHTMAAGGVIEFMRHNANNNKNNYDEDNQGMVKEEGDHKQEWKFKRAFDDRINDIAFSTEQGGPHGGEDDHDHEESRDHDRSFMEGFTELLLSTTTTTTTTSTSEKSLREDQGPYDNGSGGTNNSSITGGDYYEDNKNYWNSILHLVNSPSHSPMF